MKQKIILIGLLFLVMFMLPLSIKLSLVDSIEVDEYSVPNLSDYELHDQIEITSNSDFATQGWLGDGTKENPYVIEGLEINSSTWCIRVTSTDVYFVIRNCLLSSYRVSNVAWECVILTGIHNGIVENCIISSDAHSFWLHGCTNIVVANNTVNNRIRLDTSLECLLYNNTAIDYTGMMVWKSRDCYSN